MCKKVLTSLITHKFDNSGTTVKNLIHLIFPIYIFMILEITIIGFGLLIGLIISWMAGFPGGEVFLYIFLLFLGLDFGTRFLGDNDNDDDDFDGGMMIPAYQSN